MYDCTNCVFVSQTMHACLDQTPFCVDGVFQLFTRCPQIRAKTWNATAVPSLYGKFSTHFGIILSFFTITCAENSQVFVRKHHS